MLFSDCPLTPSRRTAAQNIRISRLRRSEAVQSTLDSSSKLHMMICEMDGDRMNTTNTCMACGWLFFRGFCPFHDAEILSVKFVALYSLDLQHCLHWGETHPQSVLICFGFAGGVLVIVRTVLAINYCLPFSLQGTK